MLMRYSFLPNRVTCIVILTLHLSLYEMSYGSFILLAVFPLLLLAVDLEKTLFRQMIQAFYFQLAWAYECFSWVPSTIDLLWQKQALISWGVYFFVIPLANMHVLPYFFLRHIFKKKLLGQRALHSLFLASAFTLLDMSFVFFDVSLGTMLHQSVELISFAKYGGAYLLTFSLVLIAEESVRLRKHGLVQFLLPTLLFVVLSIIVSVSDNQIKNPKDSVVVNAIQTAQTADDIRKVFSRTSIEGHMFLKKIFSRIQEDDRGSDILVIGESMLPPYFFDSDENEVEETKQQWQKMLSSRGSKMLAGGFRQRGNSYLNSAWFSTTDQFYDKINLMPFGEYVPLSSYFPVLLEWLYRPLPVEHGNTSLSFEIRPGVFGTVVICNEIFDTDMVNRALKGQDQVLFHLGNEAWLGHNSRGHAILLAAAKLRAVELGVPIVKVANYGISALISRKGAVFDSIGVGEDRTSSWKVALDSQKTFYYRFPWVLKVFCFVVVLVGLCMILRKKKDTGPSKGPVRWENGDTLKT